jgi:hypothetical protein
MDPIAVKLNQPELRLNFFEKNQVLTHEHLNNFIQYFDFQQRLSRTALAGKGIVGGLKVFLRKETITVTRGAGLTSDGDLLWLRDDRVFTTAVPFSDQHAKYPFFLEKEKQILLVELTDATNTTATGKELKSFFTDKNPASDYAVVMYAEQYLQDSDLCSAENCDNAGVMERNDIRFLLLLKSDLDRITAERTCCNDLQNTLPAIAAKRVIINPASDLFTFAALSSLYEDAITETVKRLAPSLQAADAAMESLSHCLIQNGGVAAKTTEGKNTADALAFNSVSSLGKIETAAKNFSNKPGIQYVYDWARDIVEAYTEFREAVFGLCHEAPDPGEFPKHLLLGEAQTSAAKHSKYRQEFIESPVLNHRDEKLQTALQRYSRMFAMLNQFSVEAAAGDEIKVTPSAIDSSPLGEKAIPAYYQVERIATQWNEEKARRRDSNSIHSYHASAYSSLPHITDPLSFDLDRYSFFRIEGHVGKKFDAVNTFLEKKIKDFDLPFDVMGLQIEDKIEKVKPRFPFTPLQVLPQFEHLKAGIADHFERVTRYHQSLVEKMPADLESKVALFAGVSSAASASTDSKKRIQTNLGKVMQKGNDALNEMNKGLLNMNVEAISKHLADFAGAGAEIEEDAEHLTTSARFSPSVLTVNNSFVSKITRLKDIVQIQQEFEHSLYIFGRFLRRHPALIHQGGVTRGGTFLLLYESDSETVMGDFFIPYLIPPPAVPETPLPPLTIRPLPVDFKNYIRFEAITPRLVNDVAFRNLTEISKQVYTRGPSVNSPGSVSPFTGKNLVFTPPSDFWDQNLGVINNTLEAATAEKREIETRVTSGFASTEDKQRADELDNIIAVNTKLAIDHVATNGGNVGAEETRVFATINNATSVVTNAEAISNISKTVESTSKNTSSTTFSKNLSTIGTTIKR